MSQNRAEVGNLQELLARVGAGLELLLEPTLSICCFRYVSTRVNDLDRFNQKLHRRLVREYEFMPSTHPYQGAVGVATLFSRRTHGSLPG